MKRSSTSDALPVLSTEVVVTILSVLSTPLLYRFLGPSAFGEYAFLLAVFSLYMVFIRSGVTNEVAKFLAEDRTSSNWTAHIIGFYFRLAILLAAFGALLLLFATWSGVIGLAVGPELTSYFYVLTLLIITTQLRDLAQKTLIGFGLERYSEPLKVLDKVCFVGVAIPLVYVGYSVVGALAGHLVASAIVGLIGLSLVHLRVSLSCVFNRTTMESPHRELVVFNSVSIILILFLESLYQIDIILLQQFAESADVGNYRAALVLAEFLWFVPIAFQTVFVHTSSELWSHNHHRKISKLASRTTRYTLLVTGLLAVCLLSLADAVIPIYFGRDATPAITPLILLIPGALGFALARPILTFAQGAGTLRYPVAATGGAAFTNLVLNLALVPQYGMHGAAVATSIGYGSMFIFHVWSARNVGFDPLLDARLERVLLSIIFAFGPIFTLSMAIADPWFALTIVSPFGFGLYFLFALLVGALNPKELCAFFTVFPDPIGSKADLLGQKFDRKKHVESSRNWLQSILFAAGLSLLLTGLSVGILEPTLLRLVS